MGKTGQPLHFQNQLRADAFFLSPSSSMLSSSFSTSSTSLGNNDEGERKSKLKIKMSSSRVKKDEPFKLDDKLPGLELKPGQVKVWHPQNPLTKLKVWLKFKEVQATWDSSIDQAEVAAGARQAVLAISSILSTGGQWGQLRGLLNKRTQEAAAGGRETMDRCREKE